MYSYQHIETQGAEHVRAASEWVKHERLLQSAHPSRFSLKRLFIRLLSRLHRVQSPVETSARQGSLQAH